MDQKLMLVFSFTFGFVACKGVKNNDVFHQDTDEINVETIVPKESSATDSYGVDLGLSVNWAECNVGATSPDEAGYEIPYGNTSGSIYYADKTPANISGTNYDIAKTKLGDGWRMPTEEEMRELIENCNMSTDVVNGVIGVRMTSVNGNSIFLPACGSGINAFWDDVEKNRKYKTAERNTIGHEGGYWTGSESVQGRKQLESMRKMGYEVIDHAGSSILKFNIDKKVRNIETAEPRRNCFPVRAVHDK